jgi:hypothetical protein
MWKFQNVTEEYATAFLVCPNSKFISWLATHVQDVMGSAGVALVLIGPGNVEQVFVRLLLKNNIISVMLFDLEVGKYDMFCFCTARAICDYNSYMSKAFFFIHTPPFSNICRFDFFTLTLTICLIKKIKVMKNSNIYLNYIM